jgi:hypothetical protein
VCRVLQFRKKARSSTAHDSLRNTKEWKECRKYLEEGQSWLCGFQILHRNTLKAYDDVDSRMTWSSRARTKAMCWTGEAKMRQGSVEEVCEVNPAGVPPSFQRLDKSSALITGPLIYISSGYEKDVNSRPCAVFSCVPPSRSSLR